MNEKSVAFTVRRARLLLGMTQLEFAHLYGVDEAEVTRWECGLSRPRAEIWTRLRTLVLRAISALDEDLVRASPIYKYLVDMDDLTHPIVASNGVLDALKSLGVPQAEDEVFHIAESDRKSTNYQISGTRALEILQANPEWRRREIVYAEAHCMAIVLGGIWVDAMIAPLPDHLAAIIEFTPSRRGVADGFQVHFVKLQDMPFQQSTTCLKQ